MSVSALTPYAQQANPLAQRVIAAADIGASYSLVGTVFGKGLIILIVVSTLDQTVQLSLDGIVDWIPIPAGATLIVDVRSDNGAFGGFRGGYVKRIGTPTTGSLYISGVTL